MISLLGTCTERNQATCPKQQPFVPTTVKGFLISQPHRVMLRGHFQIGYLYQTFLFCLFFFFFKKIGLRLPYLEIVQAQDIHQGARKKEPKHKGINSNLKCQPRARMLWQGIVLWVERRARLHWPMWVEKIQRNIVFDGFGRYFNRG